MEKATAMDAMEKALNLPELLTCIGRYLGDKRTIITCLCVCKQWKLQFEPLLWRNFEVGSSEDLDDLHPSTELMERNAPFIRSLTLNVHEIAPESHATFYSNCMQLEDLFIHVNPVYVNVPLKWTFMANIIRNLPRLRTIRINHRGGEPSHDFFEAIADCPTIVVLETYGYQFQAKDAEVYFRASATHMKRLSTTHEHFENVSKLPDGLMFQEVRYLDLKDVSGLSFDVQLDWIRRCPNLIALRLQDTRDLSPTQFCQIIPAACPHLTALHLDTDYITDEEIAKILYAIPRIEKLNMSRTSFGDKSMKALRKNFSWLKDLNLQYCHGFTGDLIHEALCSCPNLQSISGDMLDYEDISPASWVCNGLQMFDVGLTLTNTIEEKGMKGYRGSLSKEERLLVDKRSKSVKLFQRLGQLTGLQFLSIGVVDDYELEDSDVPILDTDFALDYLTGLRHIKYFSCKGLFDHRSDREVEEAVRWMLKHWPKLETLEARIVSDMTGIGRDTEEGSGGRQRAKELLRERGIDVEEYEGKEFDADYEYDEYEDDDDLYYGDEGDGFTDLEDDGYDYDEDEDDLEDLAFYMHQHTFD
ncbi:hypothetical protein BGZ68_005989 [Mortierella alpina]|nr:hypothetical protein BGZ68_005989 [Mortierella alpina]